MSTSKKSKSTSLKSSHLSDSTKKGSEQDNFLYKYISIDIIRELSKAEDVYEVEKILIKNLPEDKKDNIKHDLKEKILLDIYVEAMWFALQSHMSEDQISAFNIFIFIMLKNIENGMSLLESMVEMKNFFIPIETIVSTFLNQDDTETNASDIQDIDTSIIANDANIEKIKQKESTINYSNMNTQDNEIIEENNKTSASISNSIIETESSETFTKSSVSEQVTNKMSSFYENEFNFKQRQEISKLFTGDLVRNIFAYMRPSFYQHYKLYEYFFSEVQAPVKLNSFLEIELPGSQMLAPLLEAMSEEDFHLYQDLVNIDKTEAMMMQKNVQDHNKINKELDNSSLENYLLNKLSNHQIQQIISDTFDEVIREYECNLNLTLDVFKNDFMNKINVMQALKN